MSRINMPTDFDEQGILLDNIITQNIANPDPLKGYLEQQKIVLATDKTAFASAKTHDVDQKKLTKESENLRELRDLKFEPVMGEVKGIAQFLKTMYTPNYKAVGDWGITISDNGKVSYPASFLPQTQIFASIKAKHDSYDPGASPLSVFLTQKNIDLETSALNVTAAVANDKDFSKTTRLSENATELRNNIWNPAMKHVRLIAGYLKKLYDENQRALGLWGFVVDDSPAKPKERSTTLVQGGKITINAVVLGSILTNTGKTDIHIFKGKQVNDTPIIVKAGETYAITKGFGTITVRNPSKLEKATISVITRN